VAPRKSKPTQPLGQSFFGSLSFIVGLLSLFLVIVQGILRLQAMYGSHSLESKLSYWLTRGEIGTAVVALALALLSFPFSAKKQWNAVLGFLLGAVVVAAWVWLQNYRY